MILIDDRQGSSSLISLPPLNLCTDPSCCKPFRFIHQTEGDFWICSSGDQGHSSLASLCRLDSADVAFTGKGPNNIPILIGVEVKHITDLVSSLISGRLQDEQIPKMIGDPSKGIPRTYDVPWILYYGEYRPNPITYNLQIRKWVKDKRTGKSKETWQDFRLGHGGKGRLIPYGFAESFLLSPSFTRLGIHTKRVISLEEAAIWLSLLYKSWQKDYHKHKSMSAFNKTSDLSEEEYRRRVSGSNLPGYPIDKTKYMMAKFASQFDGIGFDKAIKVPDEFDSILDMMTAKRDRWERLPGIGKTIAKSIEETVRRKVR